MLEGVLVTPRTVSNRPPCIRHRPFGIAGDWERLRLLARALRCMGNLLCIGLTRLPLISEIPPPNLITATGAIPQILGLFHIPRVYHLAPVICPSFLGGLLRQPRVRIDPKLLEGTAIDKALDGFHKNLAAFVVAPRKFRRRDKPNLMLRAASSASDSEHQCNPRLINSTR